MLSSNILSHVLPSRSTGRSIYEELRTQDNDNESDVETQAGLAIDEENFRFHDNNHNYPEISKCQLSHSSSNRPGCSSKPYASSSAVSTSSGKDQMSASKWMSQSPRLLADDGDDDVPASLLVEGNDMTMFGVSNMGQTNHAMLPKIPVLKNDLSMRTPRKWSASELRTSPQKPRFESHRRTTSHRRDFGLSFGNAREKALWRWINVTNLDKFISEVYSYYIGAGMWCILLEGVLNLM